MTHTEILANLCQYDPLNPDHEENPAKWAQVSKGKECFCDNCHNGKTAIAEELLKTRELLKIAADDVEAFLIEEGKGRGIQWHEDAKALFPFGADEQPARPMEAHPDDCPAEDENASYMKFGY